MSLSSFSIKRPIAMMMIFTILVLAGIFSLSQLPVELYRNVSLPQISIIIEVRGGIPPTEVESLVTKLVEEAVGSVSHLQEMLSIHLPKLILILELHLVALLWPFHLGWLYILHRYHFQH